VTPPEAWDVEKKPALRMAQPWCAWRTLSGKSSKSVVKNVTYEFLVTGIVKVQNEYRIQMHSKKMHISAQYRAPEKTDSRVAKLITCMSSSQPIRAEVEIKTIDKSKVVGRLLTFLPIPQLSSI
jgi:hypothetical protein